MKSCQKMSFSVTMGLFLGKRLLFQGSLKYKCNAIFQKQFTAFKIKISKKSIVLTLMLDIFLQSQPFIYQIAFFPELDMKYCKFIFLTLTAKLQSHKNARVSRL